MSSPNCITVNQLARRVGLPDAPVIVDVCIDEDYALDERLLPTSFRHPFNTITQLLESKRDKPMVVVCQKGLKLSQGAAALLRAGGVKAEYLEGGLWAWRDAGLPLIPAGSLPEASAPGGGTLWVTRQRPKIDRVACPWLIRRFVDPQAQFLFVETASVMAVAERFDATPFDIDGAHFAHQGERCTFDTMLETFKLETEALQRLATVVRGADTNRLDLAPQAAGLMAAALGLSRMYKDDLKQLDAGLPLFDAYYRWARDAHEELHDWHPQVGPAA